MLVATAVAVPLTVATTSSRPATPAVAGPAPTASAAAYLGATDIAYLQLMIPMDVGAVRLAALAQDPALAAVVADHPAELARMRALLRAAGLPDGDLHDGHELPGLFSERQIDEVAALSPPARDARVADLLREHLTQGERVSASAAEVAEDPAVRALAVELGAARTSELARLKPGLGSG
ncbi:hypothetical protein Ais01nite_14830 [Asanoa ishikariensis]|uniref:Uncharacterized conserved protein, DUF305 family n=1 Tax=Asanoa ishikariensis TaxID=137265 RepID=A0A1H3UKD7_9ACTN|nr:hypothetical protein Ais01nite_14830 [Asanoa ishikariensis]SDZ62149.1 Uncharacterized conserved protein, DUF305 family [Asanoa ishikariensis]